MNTLEICIKHFNWQGGTIHQAKNHFSKSDMPTKDKICGEIVSHISDIDDLHNAQWFMNNRIGHLS